MQAKNYGKYHFNYATLKRRGYDDSNYQYIYTVHSCPVRMSGFEDIELLRQINAPLDYNYVVEDEVRFAASLSRSRSKVLQLGFNNKWDYFITLTFNAEKIDRYDYNAICKSLLKFFDNYKQRKSKDFKYLIIPEQHKDGAYHFHGFFMNIAPGDLKVNEHGYLDFVPYCKKYGFCSMSKIRSGEKCASYVSKYITKDMFKNTPKPNTRLYYASRGLKLDEVLTVGLAEGDPDRSVSADVKKFNNQFCSKYYCGRNVFVGLIRPLVDLDRAPELPDKETMFKLKMAALFDYCNTHNIYINDKTDLVRLYTVLKDRIVSDRLDEYDTVRQYYADIRAELNESLETLRELFGVMEINDVICIDNYSPAPSGNDVLQNSAAAPAITPPVPKSVIQLSLFDDNKGDN